MKFSVIIPVYNRPDEMAEMMESLAAQTEKNFEVVVVEDGSTLPCREEVEKYASVLETAYYFKPNTGRSHTRNYGMEKATDDYFLFFDSDCILPSGYMHELNRCLQ
ncbi:MAG: glycosyltransferase family 2 protein, partial [Bacteroidales bacterium]|nr:glycosyltransferase family 2 protein [Bacteroidales bacterium]